MIENQDMKYLKPIKKALISVSDKSYLKELAQFLVHKNIEIISTGGTQRYLESFGFKITPVESITQNPEAFGGRMKSISFQIASALLFRRDHEQDLFEAKKLEIKPIDLVICNLYPFEKYIDQEISLMKEEDLVENIDIGGPLMIRASAKNFKDVVVLSDPDQYQNFINHFEFENNHTTLEYRKHLAFKAFNMITSYDLAISFGLSKVFNKGSLRYGENPHQEAQLLPISFKSNFEKNENLKNTLVGSSQILQGKELSYNNWLDTDAAWRIVSDLDQRVCQLDKEKKSWVTVVVKHSNPCGLSLDFISSFDSLNKAWIGDEKSSFGGVLATNYKIEKIHAEFLAKNFIEILIAPDFSDESLELFKSKKNVRLIKTPLRQINDHEKMIRSISGGLLVQNEDDYKYDFDQIRCVTHADQRLISDKILQFSIISAKHLKSNAIALIKVSEQGYELWASGMGQPNRLDSLKLLAAHRATAKLKDLSDLILVSDAFFPFSDTIDLCHEVGINKIIQPGGSIKDQEVIKRCDELGIQLFLTGVRHFRH